MEEEMDVEVDLVVEAEEDVVWIEVDEEVEVDSIVVVVEVVVEALEPQWVVVKGMDLLQQSEVEWHLLPVGPWPRGADSRVHKEQMVIPHILHQANIRVAHMRHVE